MAEIRSTEESKIFNIKRWLGLNESPDGDTGLKMGEAAVMRNFRITRENHLQLRPGYAPMLTLVQGQKVRGLWCGYVSGVRHFVAACGGHLWDIATGETWSKKDLGPIADADTSFFGFSKKLYILTGTEYYTWSGTGNVTAVEGYIPVVATASAPSGGGTLLEAVNKLSGKRRQQFSPDGAEKVFSIVETGIDEVLSVVGTTITWTADLAKGTVTFASVPPKGVNTITITWRKGTGTRGKVTAMRFAELYNGSSDARVFLYGDGTNETIYSGLDELGQPTAEYFPDLNVMAVDSANTPITAMIRHYDRLLVYKTNSAHAAKYSTITLAGGAVTAVFYAEPMNREIGCAALGQAKLVDNNPRTVFGRAVYEWVLAVGAARDERNAKRISDHAEASLGRLNLEKAVTFDDEEQREFYILCEGKAIVHNYGCDAWYLYENLPIACMEKLDGETYFGSNDGKMMHFSRKYRNDARAEISAYWESGSMDFGRDFRRKYSSTVWAAMKPESQAVVLMTAQSNVKSDYPEKVLSSGIATLLNTSFQHWSFGVNRNPQVMRVRLKVKKATYYKLIFSSKSASATATILSVDIQVRYTGNVK